MAKQKAQPHSQYPFLAHIKCRSDEPLIVWGKGLSWRERLRRKRMTQKRTHALRKEQRRDEIRSLQRLP